MNLPVFLLPGVLLPAEHPFPAAVEAAADMVEWLARESGEMAPYIVGEC
jgi:acetyl esterase/lipase